MSGSTSGAFFDLKMIYKINDVTINRLTREVYYVLICKNVIETNV